MLTLFNVFKKDFTFRFFVLILYIIFLYLITDLLKRKKEKFRLSAYGKVFLVRKIGGSDSGRVYAMKVLKKTRVAQKPKTLEHTLTERQALERLKGLPFLVEMVYAFQTENKLHIVMG